MVYGFIILSRHFSCASGHDVIEPETEIPTATWSQYHVAVFQALSTRRGK